MIRIKRCSANLTILALFALIRFLRVDMCHLGSCGEVMVIGCTQANDQSETTSEVIWQLDEGDMAVGRAALL